MRPTTFCLLALALVLSAHNVAEARVRFLEADFYSSLANRLLSQLGDVYGLTDEQVEVVQDLYGSDGPTTEAAIARDRAAGELPPAGEGPFNVLDALLVKSVSDGEAPALESLIAVGADPNAKSDGASALYQAVDLADPAAVGVLLAGGADTNLPDASGDTPLLAAIASDQATVVEDLLDSGADANLAGSDGVTPLLAALQGNSTDLVPILLQHGADVNLAGPDGNTPFQVLLAGPANPEWVQAFLNQGADANLPNADGETPLDLADGDATIVALLVDAGAKVPPVAEGV